MKQAIHEVSPVTADIRHVVADIHERAASVAYAHIFTNPFPREETKHRWENYTGRIALARDAEGPVGFAAWRDDELDALYVLPEFAGHGLGSQLMALAVGTSRLWVLEDNHRARHFYQWRGWAPSGRVRHQDVDIREVEYIRQ